MYTQFQQKYYHTQEFK
jgi:hypothetical protein